MAARDTDRIYAIYNGPRPNVRPAPTLQIPAPASSGDEPAEASKVGRAPGMALVGAALAAGIVLGVPLGFWLKPMILGEPGPDLRASAAYADGETPPAVALVARAREWLGRTLGLAHR